MQVNSNVGGQTNFFLIKNLLVVVFIFLGIFVPLYENNNNNNNNVLNSLFLKEKLARIYVCQHFFPQLLTICKKSFKIFYFYVLNITKFG